MTRSEKLRIPQPGPSLCQATRMLTGAVAEHGGGSNPRVIHSRNRFELPDRTAHEQF